MPCTCIARLSGRMPISASPRWTASATGGIACPAAAFSSLSFGLISPVMPSFSNCCATKIDAAPPSAGSARAIDLAPASVFLNASSELISGFAAPFLTARPFCCRASCVVVPPTILASRTCLSNSDLVTIATSIVSSPLTFSSTLPAVAYSIFSLCPEDFSKAWANSWSAGRNPTALVTVSSAAPAVAVDRPASSARMANLRIMLLFTMFPSPNRCAPWPLQAVQPVRPAAADMVCDCNRTRQ